MHRTLVAACLTLLPCAGVAQNFQFMPFVGREQTSLLPHIGHGGIATGADLNGDGRPDLVVPLSTNTGVYVRTASGWGSMYVLSAGQRPVLVDLEGDGDLDLALVPPHLPTQTPLRLYENRQGTMIGITLLTLGSVSLQAAAIGDVDGNGIADLVLGAPPGSSTPGLVLARGAAGLQPTYTPDLTALPANLPLPLWPELLDADGDGDLDVLATNTTSGLRLLRNTGGTFSDATATLPPGIGTGHDFLASGDFDGDGRADCAATKATGDIDVLWGGAGGFTFTPAVATVPGIQHLWPADFDGDGDLDFLAQRPTGLDRIENQGNRQFTRTELLAQATSMRGVADVDGDGKADVVFATSVASPVRCRYQARFEDAAYSLGVATFLPFSMPNTVPTVGDVDGDGRADLVHAGANTITVDRALGGGAYRRSTSTPPTFGNVAPWRSELADMDGDGDVDLVLKTSSAMTVATNNLGVFPTAVSAVSAATASVVDDDLRLGDVDGDGDLDVVVAEFRGIVLFANLGNGLYAPPAIVVAPNPAPNQAPRCVELADLDGDGDLDILCDVVAASGLTHVVATNNGQGVFTPGAAFAVQLGTAPTSVRAADLDGDGDADVAVLDGTPRVYRNTGSALVERTPFDLPPNLPPCTSNLAVADFDDDGDLDLATVALADPQVLLLLNDGAGHFVNASAQRVQALVNVVGTVALRAADFDDDGDVDLLVGPYLTVVSNHLRQCRSMGAPRIGSVGEVQLLSGPGFGAPGLGVLGVGFALAAPPLHVPGLAGQLELDPATLQIVGGVATSTIGVSSVFVAVPQDLALIGLEVWFQGAILPSVGRPGFTNAVYEIVLG